MTEAGKRPSRPQEQVVSERETASADGGYEPSVVALVRAVMDYIDGECSAVFPGEHDDDEGCDACAFDALLQRLPHALTRQAVRCRLCDRCRQPIPLGSEGRLSGLCQVCLHGPVPS